ncbi:phosphate ABC transporter permease PstA [Cellulomonas soli]|uniref:Phosphate transport system permease protein PstA n=1 Tax=Cellulomonas soli TaxID=931535 RepID=A0A512PF03_9CELL|nr:phosphate ABC transporter permease PstA [Cellulomonas soli]NYI59417.1 phosphate transport system permease protein [Cellulomonas soli]GEP69791.1 phosphate transport system permease protein PstA [Cellulomonas soli]
MTHVALPPTPAAPPVSAAPAAPPAPSAGSTLVAPARGTTHVRTLPPVRTPPDTRRRRVAGVPGHDRLVLLGSLAAAAALAWVLCFRLLPWGTPLAYAVVTFATFLAVVTVATSATADGPAVADRLAGAVVTGGALTVAVALTSTVVFTFVRGFGALRHWSMLFDDMAGVGPRDPLSVGGVGHAVLGTLIEIGLAVAFTVPLGLGAAVFMTEVGGRFSRVVRTVVEAMTALPSIVAGLFVYTVLIVGLGVPRSGLAAAVALSVMMLPIIARAADVVLRVVPSGLREASAALGAPRWRTVWHVVLPTARPGLATALILGVARGIGETSPVLLTSGAASFFVANPMDGVMNSLPLFIYSSVRSGEPGLVQRGFATATILLVLVLVLFVVARLVARRPAGR